MPITPNEIKSLIGKAIPDAQVEVEDLTGGGDHFQILVVSQMFQGKLLIDQHRLVQKALESAMTDGRIHAVQIKTSVPGQKTKKDAQNDGLNIISMILVSLLLFSPSAHAKLENFQAADMVLGQPNFTSNAANNGAATPSAGSMNAPLDIYSDGRKLFVVDFNNRRVLIWNSIPTSNFAPADTVIGQPDFTSATADNGGVSARSLNSPSCVFHDGKRLFVSDFGTHRVLMWNTTPTINFTPADVVLGQPDFTTNTANNGGVSARSLNIVNEVFSDGKRLFIADTGNHRILIWNKIPTSNFAPADIVLGQPDLTQNTLNNGGISARSLWTPTGVFSDGKRLFAVDRNNHRALIWNSIPTANFVPADVVLGQPDFISNTANNGGVSAKSINTPRLLLSDGKRLFITEQGNHRLLIWNKIPTTNFEPADIVLGQPDFTSTAGNNGGISARSVGNNVRDVFLYGGKLFVSDQSNHRVLIFNLSGSTTQQDPQFEQGKAVVGKVFNDINGNGIQDQDVGATPRGRPLEENGQAQGPAPTGGIERGLEGIKIVSDTGIYAITDQDGKYHFPFIETGQHVLKIDPDTLPEGSTLTTDNPYKVTITKGILTKVSFGVKIPESVNVGATPRGRPLDSGQAQGSAPTTNDDLPLLQVTITQDTSSKPVKELGITAEIISVPGTAVPGSQNPARNVPGTDERIIKFTTTCNYFLFVKESEIRLYHGGKKGTDSQKKGTDYNLSPFSILKLPHPIPLYYEIPLQDILSKVGAIHESPLHLYYQLIVRDAQGHEDRTSVGRIEIK